MNLELSKIDLADDTLIVELPIDILKVKRVLIRDTQSNYGAVFYDDRPSDK